MKQLLSFSPVFNPATGTLDFTQYPGFSVNRLYAVINVTQNSPLYVAGAPGYGIANTIGSVITLSANTSAYSTTDKINVYYDTDPGIQSNTVKEYGGSLQAMQESIDQVLVELKTMNFILAQGLNINIDDMQAIRNDVNNIQNSSSVY